MKILIPMLACLLLVGGCVEGEFKGGRNIQELTVTMAPEEGIPDTIFPIPSAVVDTTRNSAHRDSTYTINMADFDETIPPRWHWEYRWVMMECLKSDLGSGIEYAVWTSPDTCWQQERYKVYEPCDSILDQPCPPETVYLMPPGRWVTIDELRREEYPWPDSVFILSGKGE